MYNDVIKMIVVIQVEASAIPGFFFKKISRFKYLQKNNTFAIVTLINYNLAHWYLYENSKCTWDNFSKYTIEVYIFNINFPIFKTPPRNVDENTL